MQRELFGIERSHGLIEGELVVAVVQRGQNVAGLDLLVGNDVHLGDIAGNLRRDRRDIAFDVSVVGRD
ncbi:hypothetical protein D3C86_2267060 [compost metagenome]